MTSSIDPILEPCPFCGKPPVCDEHSPTPGEDDSFVVIRCASCGISKEHNFKSNAFEWWNTRTLPVSAGEPVAWRVRVRKRGVTFNVYTERLPFDPSDDEYDCILGEPEPLYAAPQPVACPWNSAADFLARTYPDNANTNAFCAALRSQAAPSRQRLFEKNSEAR